MDTKTGHLDDVFDEEEREFLLEVVEMGLIDTRKAHQEAQEDDFIVNEPANTPEDNAEDYVVILARMNRKLVFLQLLLECLDEGGEHGAD